MCDTFQQSQIHFSEMLVCRIWKIFALGFNFKNITTKVIDNVVVPNAVRTECFAILPTDC